MLFSINYRICNKVLLLLLSMTVIKSWNHLIIFLNKKIKDKFSLYMSYDN
jgi:hypothetical protein